jgi:hypothetical protein
MKPKSFFFQHNHAGEDRWWHVIAEMLQEILVVIQRSNLGRGTPNTTQHNTTPYTLSLKEVAYKTFNTREAPLSNDYLAEIQQKHVNVSQV